MLRLSRLVYQIMMAACVAVTRKSPSYLSLFNAFLQARLQIKVGDHLPNIGLFEGSPGNEVNIHELYKGKRGVLFSVLGAFTPGCTLAHIPEYINNYDKFKEEGYDLICCVSVNDPFVMSAWGKDIKAEGKIRMLADPEAKFAKATNMDLDCRKLLGNIRSKRFSLVVEDSVIKSINREPDHTGLACLLCIKNMKYPT